jgi:hypothetical protein
MYRSMDRGSHALKKSSFSLTPFLFIELKSGCMTRDETEVSLRMPTGLVEKIGAIPKMKYLNRADVISDACAYYCQFHDMHSERFPETMRNVFFDLTSHDDEFRRTIRDLLRGNPSGEF